MKGEKGAEDAETGLAKGERLPNIAGLGLTVEPRRTSNDTVALPDILTLVIGRLNVVRDIASQGREQGVSEDDLQRAFQAVQETLALMQSQIALADGSPPLRWEEIRER